MSRTGHTIYLSIIGVLLAIVWLSIVSTQSDKLTESPIERIAVFPFIAMDSPSNAVAKGLTNDVLAFLGNAEYVDVIPESELQPELRAADDHQIWATEMSASLILEGSVKSVIDEFLVTAQLIDGRTGKHVWSASFKTDSDVLSPVVKEIEENVYLLASR